MPMSRELPRLAPGCVKTRLGIETSIATVLLITGPVLMGAVTGCASRNPGSEPTQAPLADTGAPSPGTPGGEAIVRADAATGDPDATTPNEPLGFPRQAIQSIVGSQADIPSSNWADVAIFDVVILGSNWETVGSSHGNTSVGSVISGIKAVTGSLYSPLRLVGRYEIFEVVPTDTSKANFLALVNAAQGGNGWWLRSSFPSGPIVEDGTSGVVNYSTSAEHDPSGQTPYQAYAQYTWDTLFLGRGGPVNGPNAFNEASNADFVFLDNTPPFSAFSGDWLQDGSSAGSNPGTSAAAMAIQGAQLELRADVQAAAGSSKLCFINQSLGQATSLGVGFSAGVGAFDGAMQQFCWGQGLAYAAENFGGFATMMQFYVDQLSGGATYVLPTGPVSNSDAAGFQYFRYVYGSMAADNGYPVFGLVSYLDGDAVDGATASTLPIFDEMTGGSLHLNKWLGTRANPNGITNSNAVSVGKSWREGNSVPWQNGCYRYDFENGIVIVSPKGNNGNAPVTVTLETSYYHMRGSQQPSINTGAPATSVTLNGTGATTSGDAIFLGRTAVP
jgi:hypothetical protein